MRQSRPDLLFETMELSFGTVTVASSDGSKRFAGSQLPRDCLESSIARMQISHDSSCSGI